MAKILILEDMGPRVDQFMTEWFKHELYIVNKPGAAVNILMTLKIDLVTLDHDLGMTGNHEPSDENSGFAVAEWLGAAANSPTWTLPEHMLAHTWSQVGAKNMINVCPRLLHIPFGDDYFKKITIP